LATGTAEREAAARLSERLSEGAPLGADKMYEAKAFVEGLKARGIEAHVVINGTVSKRGKTRKTAVPREGRQASATGSANGCASVLRNASAGHDGGLAQLKLRGVDKVRAISSSLWPPTIFFTGPSSGPPGPRVSGRREEGANGRGHAQFAG
jgi:hypothetical protein